MQNVIVPCIATNVYFKSPKSIFYYTCQYGLSGSSASASAAAAIASGSLISTLTPTGCNLGSANKQHKIISTSDVRQYNFTVTYKQLSTVASNCNSEIIANWNHCVSHGIFESLSQQILYCNTETSICFICSKYSFRTLYLCHIPGITASIV